MADRVDLTGKDFGRLHVEGPGVRPRHWRCKCSCPLGTIKEVFGPSLTSPNGTRGCVCLRNEANSKRLTTHGHTAGGKRSAEFTTWLDIKHRCYTPSEASYERYGARGIRMCARWREDYAAFFADLGSRPSARHTIDRQDTDGHYSCGKCQECQANGWSTNCKWSTPKEQARNRRNNTVIEHQGRSQCLAAWSEETGIPTNTLCYRLKSGWDPSRVLTTPVGKQGKRKAKPAPQPESQGTGSGNTADLPCPE